MRCLSCNTILSDYETSLSYIEVEDKEKYISLCIHCLNTTDINFVGNPDLRHIDSDQSDIIGVYHEFCTSRTMPEV